LIVSLKDRKLLKLTEYGKLFHTLIITLHEKKYTLPLLHLGLYNLYACPLVFETQENSRKKITTVELDKSKNNFITVFIFYIACLCATLDVIDW